MKQTREILGLIVFVLFSLSTSITATTGYSRFMMGNSFTLGLNSILDQVIEDAGYPDDTRETKLAGGATLDKLWNGGKSGIIDALSTKGPFEFIVLQPHGQLWYRPVIVESNAANSISHAAVEHNPQCTLLVYCTWSESPASLGNKSWEEAMDEAINGHHKHMFNDVKREFPGRPVFIVPSGPALLALNDSIKAGKVPGYTTMEQLYRDRIHLNAEGNYLNACVHFASLYKQSPVGLPHKYVDETNDTINLTDEQAAIFQHIAWDVVRSYPQTTLSGVLFPPKTDATPPPFFSNLHFGDTTSRNLTITWDAYTEDAEGAVFIDSIWIGNNVDMVTKQPLVTIGGLKPGEINTIMVTLWDSLCNYSINSYEIAVPEEQGDALLKWKPSDLSRGENPSLPVSFIEEMFKNTPTFTRGNGLRDVSHFGGVFTAANIDQTSLNGAINNNDYFAFSIIPDENQHYSARRLTFRFFQQHPDAYCSIALMTSKTGFEEGKEVAVFPRLAAMHNTLEFDISTVSELQNIADSVEYRLYVWGDKSPATAGFGAVGNTDFSWGSVEDVEFGGIVESPSTILSKTLVPLQEIDFTIRVQSSGIHIVPIEAINSGLIKIFSLSGRLVSSTKIVKRDMFISLSKGVHIVRMVCDGTAKTKHVVIR